jgi:hypothetical protein
MLRPAALRILASRIIERPMIKATTGFPWRGWWPAAGALEGGAVEFIKRGEQKAEMPRVRIRFHFSVGTQPPWQLFLVCFPPASKQKMKNIAPLNKLTQNGIQERRRLWLKIAALAHTDGSTVFSIARYKVWSTRLSALDSSHR